MTLDKSVSRQVERTRSSSKKQSKEKQSEFTIIAFPIHIFCDNSFSYLLYFAHLK